MTTHATQAPPAGRLAGDVRRFGDARHDEVWDGEPFISPMPSNQHQGLTGDLHAIFWIIAKSRDLGAVLPGANVSDQEENWTANYRVPDVAVVLRGGKAQDKKTHLFGGPDLVVEIASPDDHCRNKIPFYAKIDVRELLILNRSPWDIELFRHDGRMLSPVARLSAENPGEVLLETLPLRIRLSIVQGRPIVDLSATDGGAEQWTVG